MHFPRMTTRTLMAAIVIVALSLALVIQSHRAARHAAESRVAFEEQLTAALLEVRDLRKREMMRLENDYRSLYKELEGGNANPRTTPRLIAMQPEIERARASYNETIDQLRASLKRIKATAATGITIQSPAPRLTNTLPPK